MPDLKKSFMAGIVKAQKILGKQAKMPTPQADILKLFAEADKSRTELNKARSAMLDKIQNYENDLDKIKNDIVSYRNKLTKEKFGLDDKKPEDKKKIDQAKKIMNDACGDVSDGLIDAHNAVNELDKVLEQDIE